MMASKNYVVATAQAPHARRGETLGTKYGREGVFKTVVAINEAYEGSNKLFTKKSKMVTIGASNLANGSPSIAGFPLLLGSGDLRYVKYMAFFTATGAVGSNDAPRQLWLSTEIVSPMFFRFGSLQNDPIMAMPWSVFGDSGVNVTGGYGELTYSYQQDYAVQ
jgi:hypothetical protein